MAWTDERCDQLRKLYTEGFTASQIAAELGGDISRNAVIGKAMRMGLGKRGNQAEQSRASAARRRGQPRKPPSPRPSRLHIAGSGQGGSRLVFVNQVELEPMRDLPASEIPIGQRKVIATIGFDDCRWPYGDPGTPDFFFCGAERVSCLPYCRAHASIAYKPAPGRRLSAEEHMRRSLAARRRAKEGQQWGSAGT